VLTDDYMKPPEAARYIKSSTSTLAKRRLNGDGPKFTRIGRAIRYRKIDLDAWMASRLAASTSEIPASGPGWKKLARMVGGHGYERR
jgi:predicted DNA-binding transcriptional regulator AlpA